MTVLDMDLFYTVRSSDSFASDYSLVELYRYRDVNGIDLYDFGVFFDQFIVLDNCNKLLLADLVTVSYHFYVMEFLDSCTDWDFVFEHFVFLEQNTLSILQNWVLLNCH